MKYPFAYTIQSYNYNEGHYYLDNGVGVCESFKDAVDILEQRYGNGLTAIKHLELYGDDTVITLPKGTFDEVVDCLESDECFEVKCDEKGVKIISCQNIE
jgi:hypothetical protein